MREKSKKKSSRRSTENRIIIPRRKTSELNGLEEIPYKDAEFLSRYVTERGKILPRRITGTTASTQRALKLAIKRARNIALLSFSQGYLGEPGAGDSRHDQGGRHRDGGGRTAEGRGGETRTATPQSAPVAAAQSTETPPREAGTAE